MSNNNLGFRRYRIFCKDSIFLNRLQAYARIICYDMLGARDNRFMCVEVYRIQIALTHRARYRLDSLFYRYIKVIVSHTVDMPSTVTFKCPRCRAFANSAHVANINYVCRDIMSPSLQLYAQCTSYTINIYSIVRCTNGTPEIYRRTIRYMHNLEEGKNAIFALAT